MLIRNLFTMLSLQCKAITSIENIKLYLPSTIDHEEEVTIVNTYQSSVYSPYDSSRLVDGKGLSGDFKSE